jgi:hypothetical protein
MMTIKLHRQYEGIRRDSTAWDSENNATAWTEVPVLLWKFVDENGDLWNTETAIDGTEEEAASIILGNTK